MTNEEIRKILGWCSVVNIGVFCVAMVGIRVLHDTPYLLFGIGFGVTVESFDALQMQGLIMYNIFILMFNVVPYFAMRMLENRRPSINKRRSSGTLSL